MIPLPVYFIVKTVICSSLKTLLIINEDKIYFAFPQRRSQCLKMNYTLQQGMGSQNLKINFTFPQNGVLVSENIFHLPQSGSRYLQLNFTFPQKWT